MITHRWLAVRCCCKPQTLLGFLRLPESQCRRGQITLKKIFSFDLETQTVLETQTIRLELVNGPGTIAGSPGWATELAVYSDDHPQEFWKQFGEDFIPAPKEEDNGYLYSNQRQG